MLTERDWSKGFARQDEHGPEHWGTWVTPRGTVVRAYRGKRNRVRFYRADGRTCGVEQSNVAPAHAYAMAHGWSHISPGELRGELEAAAERLVGECSMCDEHTCGGCTYAGHLIAVYTPKASRRRAG